MREQTSGETALIWVTRPALILASIFLFGCGTPFHLLVHNDLRQDAEITVRYSEKSFGEKKSDSVGSAFVPKGRAEELSLGWRRPLLRWIEFEWRDGTGKHVQKIDGKKVPFDFYHAYVNDREVRFAPRDWMDRLHEDMTSFVAPIFWYCLLAGVLIPTLLLGKLVKKKRKG